MSDTIKLFNKGRRTIHGEGFSLEPEKMMSFPSEIAARLKRLYPNELLSMDDVQKQFVADATPTEPTDASDFAKADISPAAAKQEQKKFKKPVSDAS